MSSSSTSFRLICQGQRQQSKKSKPEGTGCSAGTFPGMHWTKGKGQASRKPKLLQNFICSSSVFQGKKHRAARKKRHDLMVRLLQFPESCFDLKVHCHGWYSQVARGVLDKDCVVVLSRTESARPW